MDLVTSTTLVMLTSIVFSALPFMFTGLRKHARTLNFIGGILLTGVLVFDVIPEMMEHGGAWSLLVTVGAFAVFTSAHVLLARRKGGHAGHDHSDSEMGCASGNWLAGSLALHCLACGMLLCGSHEVSETFALHVALSLMVHKAVEAFALSSLLVEKTQGLRQRFLAIGTYTIAFPVGVAIAEFGIGGENLEHVAILATSLGVGALFGCLVQDFYLPVLRTVRLNIVRQET